MEDYEKAFIHIDHSENTHWSPDLIRQAIKSYGIAKSSQRVTSSALSNLHTQRKNITRFSLKENGYFGYIWYDLNIDVEVSDLTATFDIYKVGNFISIRLDDIHAM